MRLIKLLFCFITALLFSSLQAQVERNLKAYYSFDNASLKDDVGSLDLSSNSPTYGTDRYNDANKSMLFNPSGNTQAYLEDSIMDLRNDFSISFWFKMDTQMAVNGYNLISSRKSKSNVEMGAVEFLVWRDSLLRCNVRNFFTELSELKSTTHVVKDSWYHVVLVREADSSFLYINNKLEHKLPLITNLNVSPAVFWSFGSDAGNRVLRGNIDDARFYNDDLNTKEIDTLYRFPLNAASTKRSKFHSTISVYPNPAQDELHIVSSDVSTISNQSTIKIYDIQGRILLSGFKVNAKSIDIKDLKPSSYILLIKDENGDTFTSKFTKL